MSIPFIRQFSFTHGQPDRLSALVTRVICNNPGPFTFTGSGTYLVGKDTLAVIDPGPADDAHLAAIMAAAQGRPVTHILVTHTHRDHCGGAAALKAETGAPLHAWGAHPSPPDKAPPALDEGGDFAFVPDVTLGDGDSVSGHGWTLQALHTPGHISNHLCFALPEEKSLFTGDHVMSWATTVVAPPDGNMVDYMASLDRLLARDDRVYYPTHGAALTEPGDFVRAVKMHREERDRQILAAVKAGHHGLMEIVEHVYAGVDRSLHVAAALNVRAHLDRHVQGGAVSVSGTGPLDLRYRSE